MMAGAAVLALLLGAIAGSLARAIRRGFAWMALLAAAAYFATTVLTQSFSLVGAAAFGVAPLVLTFLASWLTAGYLETRMKLRRLWAALAAFGAAVAAGSLWLLSFRLGVWAGIGLVLAADMLLIVSAVLSRGAPRPRS